MNWTNEAATESQLGHLKHFGYEAEHALTRGEAAHLIRDFEEHPEREAAFVEHEVRQTTRQEAHRLRLAVDNASGAVSAAVGDQAEGIKRELAAAVVRRRDFWTDTCREPGQMNTASEQVFDLYRKHGCRFVAPTHQQVQEILDALDSVMPVWDLEHPELFYQTVELNYPELRRHV